MKSSPAWQFYPSEFVESAGDLTAEETGILVLLECREWKEVGIVLDLERLAVYCKVTPAKFRKAWARLSGQFELRDGRWYYPSHDREREKQERRRAGAVDGANKTNAKRHGQRSLSDSLSDDSGVAERPISSRTAVAVSSSASANGSRARASGNGHRHGAGPAPYAPGHLNLPEPVFCEECGSGVLEEVPGQKRPIRVHGSDCSQRPFVALAAREG